MVNVLAQGPATPLPQNQQKWNTNGNSVTSTDFIGTTNATSLIFRTNNLKALEIDPNADLFLKNLSGTGNGIIRYDNLGKIERIPFNQNFSQVLSSSGVWSEISTLIGLQLNNTDIIQTAPGKVGIGTVSPMEKLHVNGNLRIDGDLILHNLNGQGEGIIKHDQNGKIEHIQFNNSFTQVLSSSGVWQEISTFTGLQVNNNDIIQTTTGNFGIGTKAPQAKLDVNGDVKVSGNFTANGSLTFAGNKKISFTPASAGHSEVLSFGPVDPIPPPSFCFAPTVPLNYFEGLLASGGYTSDGFSNLMSMGWDGANGIIDIAGENSDGIAPRLLVNYYCGKDVLMCTGPSGGNIYMSAGDNGGNVIMCTGLMDKLD
ncbi:MAG: hypothetical protein A3F72_12160 [Bacteroidetes bacterium RIFCSPLOWO2_12_FULL_35_15]|nr:MAG: hypothetical protein A3F72_12160 [Bacteroidetes bacterium RIFCSPLOWO2_12_FULL_35_15]